MPFQEHWNASGSQPRIFSKTGRVSLHSIGKNDVTPKNDRGCRYRAHQDARNSWCCKYRLNNVNTYLNVVCISRLWLVVSVYLKKVFQFGTSSTVHYIYIHIYRVKSKFHMYPIAKQISSSTRYKNYIRYTRNTPPNNQLSGRCYTQVFCISGLETRFPITAKSDLPKTTNHWFCLTSKLVAERHHCWVGKPSNQELSLAMHFCTGVHGSPNESNSSKRNNKLETICSMCNHLET